MQTHKKSKTESVHLCASIITIIQFAMLLAIDQLRQRQLEVDMTDKICGPILESENILPTVIFALPFYIVIVTAFSISFANALLLMIDKLGIQDSYLVLWTISVLMFIEIIGFNYYSSTVFFGEIDKVAIGFIFFVIASMITVILLVSWTIHRING